MKSSPTPKQSRLIEVAPRWELLHQSLCPMCGATLHRVWKTGVRICKGKCGFVIGGKRFDEMTAKQESKT